MSIAADQIDLPYVVAEVTACFEAYEAALMGNEVPALLGHFWADERLTRYGMADRQLGWAEQVAYRQATAAPDFTRRLENLRICAPPCRPMPCCARCLPPRPPWRWRWWVPTCKACPCMGS